MSNSDLEFTEESDYDILLDAQSTSKEELSLDFKTDISKGSNVNVPATANSTIKNSEEYKNFNVSQKRNNETGSIKKCKDENSQGNNSEVIGIFNIIAKRKQGKRDTEHTHNQKISHKEENESLSKNIENRKQSEEVSVQIEKVDKKLTFEETVVNIIERKINILKDLNIEVTERSLNDIRMKIEPQDKYCNKQLHPKEIMLQNKNVHQLQRGHDCVNLGNTSLKNNDVVSNADGRKTLKKENYNNKEQHDFNLLKNDSEKLINKSYENRTQLRRNYAKSLENLNDGEYQTKTLSYNTKFEEENIYCSQKEIDSLKGENVNNLNVNNVII